MVCMNSATAPRMPAKTPIHIPKLQENSAVTTQVLDPMAKVAGSRDSHDTSSSRSRL